uniref:Uncharacterized protein n=1 Tax=Solanum lycopersicum TaxID=4081 RepID=K4B0Q3_SOLLC
MWIVNYNINLLLEFSKRLKGIAGELSFFSKIQQKNPLPGSVGTQNIKQNSFPTYFMKPLLST